MSCAHAHISPNHPRFANGPSVKPNRCVSHSARERMTLMYSNAFAKRCCDKQETWIHSARPCDSPVQFRHSMTWYRTRFPISALSAGSETKSGMASQDHSRFIAMLKHSAGRCLLGICTVGRWNRSSSLTSNMELPVSSQTTV